LKRTTRCKERLELISATADTGSIPGFATQSKVVR